MTRAEKLLVYCFVSFSDGLVCLFARILLPIETVLHMINSCVFLAHFLFYLVHTTRPLIVGFYAISTFLTIIIHSLYLLSLGWTVWFIITVFHIVCLFVLIRIPASCVLSFYIFTELMIHNLYIVSYFLLAHDPIFSKQSIHCL